MNAVLVIALLACMIGWLNRYVCCAALLSYILEKDNELPTRSELQPHLIYVWKKVLHINSENPPASAENKVTAALARIIERKCAMASGLPTE